MKITRKPSDASDPVNQPFRDDAERVEAAWLVAREADPGAPPPSPELAAEYAGIEHLLADLPSSSDESWHADVLRAAARPRAPWRTRAASWWLGGAGAALAAAAAWLLLVQPPRLEIETRRVHAIRSAADELATGDLLVVTARPDQRGDLRVYRLPDGKLIARCPDGPGCRTPSHEELVIETTLDAPAAYQVILVDELRGALPVGTMDAFLAGARAAGARIDDDSTPIVVH